VLLTAPRQGIRLDGPGDLHPAHLTGAVGPVVEPPQGHGHRGQVRLERRQLPEIPIAVGSWPTGGSHVTTHDHQVTVGPADGSVDGMTQLLGLAGGGPSDDQARAEDRAAEDRLAEDRLAEDRLAEDLPGDDQVLSDDELTELALAADPAAPLPADAVPLDLQAGSRLELLPSWYMAPVARHGSKRRYRLAVAAVVVAFVTIDLFGLCATYGPLVLA
jgi:hypothetical protein